MKTLILVAWFANFPSQMMPMPADECQLVVDLLISGEAILKLKADDGTESPPIIGARCDEPPCEEEITS